MEAHANADVHAQAKVEADVDGSASIGKQVSAGACSQVDAIAEYVLELLGITSVRTATRPRKRWPAIEAVVSADVSEQAEARISTALDTIGDPHLW